MLAALSLAAPASPAPIEDKRLRGVHTWAMAIGNGALANVMRRPGAFDLVVVDGEEIRRAQVLKLRRHGTLVLGYLSVGTIESYRWWHSAADPYKLELWGDWGEWYADVSRLGFRDLLANRVAPGMLNKGLTGLFLDNTDMVETHAAQRPGCSGSSAAWRASSTPATGSSSPRTGSRRSARPCATTTAGTART